MRERIVIDKNASKVSSVKVAISRTHESRYCTLPPFHPSSNYPEYPFKSKDCLSEEGNRTYEAVRQVLLLLGMDPSNYGQKSWNPLGDLIKPGTRILIKPNFVYHESHNGINALVTHSSLIRSLLDYVCIAMDGRGTIVIGDSPIQGADFDRLVEVSGLSSIVQFFSRLPDLRMEVVDFRTEKVLLNKEGVIVDKLKLPGDPAGYTTINLRDKSLLKEVEHLAARFRVTMYNKREMFKHHSGSTHEYLIPNTVFNSDLIISLPKLKTHRIAGFTGALKSTIGLVGRKDWLPHFCRGSASSGGDQFNQSSFRKWLIAELSDKIDASDNIVMRKLLTRLRQIIHRMRYRFPYKDPALWGEWYGNDTIWRTILDVFRIIRYTDPSGKLNGTNPKKFLTIVDGIIAGEGEAPLAPTPKKTGWIIGGMEPVAVDLVCTTLMGFDYKKIPQIQNALIRTDLGLFPWSVDDIQISLWPNDNFSIDHLSDISDRFVAPEGWQGYL